MDNLLIGAVIFNTVVCGWIVYVLVEDILGKIRFRRVLDDFQQEEAKAKRNTKSKTRTARRAGAKKEIEKAFKEKAPRKNRTTTRKASR